MVHAQTTFHGVKWRRAADQHHRHMLRASAGQPADRAEIADAVRRQHSANAIGARVAVGGVGRIELVAGADKIDPVDLAELLQKLQIKISRHAENMAHADLAQTPKEKVSDRHLHWNVLLVECYSHFTLSAGSCHLLREDL